MSQLHMNLKKTTNPSDKRAAARCVLSNIQYLFIWNPILCTGKLFLDENTSSQKSRNSALNFNTQKRTTTEITLGKFNLINISQIVGTGNHHRTLFIFSALINALTLKSSQLARKRRSECQRSGH